MSSEPLEPSGLVYHMKKVIAIGVIALKVGFAAAGFFLLIAVETIVFLGFVGQACQR